jgi:hypothetical protein
MIASVVLLLMLSLTVLLPVLVIFGMVVARGAHKEPLHVADGFVLVIASVGEV